MKNEALQMAKGVRDFGPAEKIARDKILETLKKVFESFGYNPIETPTLERYELFASKYGIGQESDSMAETFKLSDQGKRQLVLRTEFTVPFARFVGMNQQMRYPFKRYQMGTVFRDGPIKLGRYREFVQCDVDVVGIANNLIDAELLTLTATVFKQLGLDVVIKINNRKILNGILSSAAVPVDQQISAIISIDKLDKIGREGVAAELKENGISEQSANRILDLISISGNNEEIIAALKSAIGENEGLAEVKIAIENALDNENIVFSPALARGLAYYTGNVFEVFLKNGKLTSALGGGGRYDNMIGGFLGDEKVYPAIGISFGLETIFDALQITDEKFLNQTCVTDVYIVPIGESSYKYCLETARTLRESGLKVDIDMLARKTGKCLEFADSYGIRWVIMIGEDEISAKKVTLKDLSIGEQYTLSVKDAIEKIQK